VASASIHSLRLSIPRQGYTATGTGAGRATFEKKARLQRGSPVVSTGERVAAFRAVHFALDICSMPSPLFTGLPAMMQNLPVMQRLSAIDAAGPLWDYQTEAAGQTRAA
jgi:hypothetical protein